MKKELIDLTLDEVLVVCGGANQVVVSSSDEAVVYKDDENHSGTVNEKPKEHGDGVEDTFSIGEVVAVYVGIVAALTLTVGICYVFSKSK